MLMDPFNRIISYLRVSVTDRCNLRCRYCIDGNFPFMPHDAILRYEEILRFIRACADLGISKVRLTGGEPLTRKGVCYLINEISQTPGIDDISVTTNGVFLGAKAKELKEAGLRRVNISLDTLKRERFAYITGVDALDDVLASIEESMSVGFSPIKLNTVIIRGFNDDEVLEFAALAGRWNLHVRFIEFMPWGDSDLWDASRIVHSEELKSIIGERYTLTPSPEEHRGPAEMFTLGESGGDIGFISPVSSHICSRCNRIRLTSDGMLRPCLFSDQEYDIKALLRAGATEEAVQERVLEVVKAKPEKKGEIGYIRKCQRSMRHIGG
jgi:GTP 3',8-cyclase